MAHRTTTSLIVACIWLSATLLCDSTLAQHKLISSHSAPGTIGRKLLASGRLDASAVQPVCFTAPEGSIVFTAIGSEFFPEPTDATIGFQVGRAYRLKVSFIPTFDELFLFPTVEIIDRLNPPRGQERDFPVPIEFTMEDLQLAAAGNMVTRVIYVEDPTTALPELQKPGINQPYFEAEPGSDPLHAADTLGRAIAILRIGSRAPAAAGPTPEFMLFSPPVDRYGAKPMAWRKPTGSKPNGLASFEMHDAQLTRLMRHDLPLPVPLRPVHCARVSLKHRGGQDDLH